MKVFYERVVSLHAFAKSIVGSSGINGDVFYISSDNSTFVVSDGASGAKDKVEASRCCIKPFEDLSFLNSRMTVAEYIKKMILTANEHLINLSNKEERLSFATLTVAVLEQNSITIGAVGDTPAFLYRNRSISKVVKPKRKYAPLVEHGFISEDEAEKLIATLPSMMWSIFDNYLPMVIPEIAMASFTVEQGDMIIICTDGVSDIVKPDEIAGYLKEGKDINQVIDVVLDDVVCRCPHNRDDATLLMVKV